MAFKNRIRLPIRVHRPQFQEERNVFRKANGESKVVSAVVRKMYTGETNMMPEKWHERFKMALSHDKVTLETNFYLGDVVQDGDYTIEWPEFPNFPEAKASFTAEVTPFNASNSNCRTCEEISQLSLVDDKFPDPLEELEEYSMDVTSNDNICCSPSVFSIVSYNVDILSSAEIDQSGIITVVLKDDLEDANDATLLTYRVTCPDGSYDDAVVTADIDGSVEACLAPTNIALQSPVVGADGVVVWDAIAGAVSYDVELYSSDFPGTPVHTNNVTVPEIAYEDLVIDHPVLYRVRIRTNCESGSSPYVEYTFGNDVAVTSCGSFRISYVGSVYNMVIPKTIEYTNCRGIYNARATLYTTVTVCMLMSSPGVPVYFNSFSHPTLIEYLGDC